MFELLKKIGIPATVALVVTALVTVVPMVFGIDGRYAKADEIEKTNRRITEIAAEINKIAGAQETLIVIISQQTPRPDKSIAPLKSAPSPAPAVVVPPSKTFAPPLTTAAPAPVPGADVSKQLDVLRKDTQRAQARVQELQKY